jgi:hypothetical protein
VEHALLDFENAFGVFVLAGIRQKAIPAVQVAPIEKRRPALGFLPSHSLSGEDSQQA